MKNGAIFVSKFSIHSFFFVNTQQCSGPAPTKLALGNKVFPIPVTASNLSRLKPLSHRSELLLTGLFSRKLCLICSIYNVFNMGSLGFFSLKKKAQVKVSRRGKRIIGGMEDRKT